MTEKAWQQKQDGSWHLLGNTHGLTWLFHLPFVGKCSSLLSGLTFRAGLLTLVKDLQKLPQTHVHRCISEVIPSPIMLEMKINYCTYIISFFKSKYLWGTKKEIYGIYELYNSKQMYCNWWSTRLPLWEFLKISFELELFHRVYVELNLIILFFGMRNGFHINHDY